MPGESRSHASLAAGLAAIADAVAEGADALWYAALPGLLAPSPADGTSQPLLRRLAFNARFGLAPRAAAQGRGPAPLELLGLEAPAGPAHRARLALQIAATPEPAEPPPAAFAPPPLRLRAPRWFVGAQELRPGLLPPPDDDAPDALLLRLALSAQDPLQGALLGMRLPRHASEGGLFDFNPDARWRRARLRLTLPGAGGMALERLDQSAGWPGALVTALLDTLLADTVEVPVAGVLPEGVLHGAAREAVGAGAGLAATLAARRPGALAAALGAVGYALVGFELEADATIAADGQPAGTAGLEESDPGAVTARIALRLESDGGATLRLPAPPDLTLGAEQRAAAALVLARAAGLLSEGEPRRAALLRGAPAGTLRALLRSRGGHGAGGQRQPMAVLARLDDGGGPPALLHLALDLHHAPSGDWDAGLSGETEPQWIALPGPGATLPAESRLAALTMRSAALAGTWWRAVTGVVP
jgi:hypothetical protein